jgi:hypothetical protein
MAISDANENTFGLEEKFRIQQQLLHFVYIYNVSEDVKFDNYQRFVGLLDYQNVRLTNCRTIGALDCRSDLAFKRTSAY